MNVRTSVSQRRGRTFAVKIFRLPGKIVHLARNNVSQEVFVNVNATYRTYVRLNDEVAENSREAPFAYEETAMFP